MLGRDSCPPDALSPAGGSGGQMLPQEMGSWASWLSGRAPFYKPVQEHPPVRGGPQLPSRSPPPPFLLPSQLPSSSPPDPRQLPPPLLPSCSPPAPPSSPSPCSPPAPACAGLSPKTGAEIAGNLVIPALPLTFQATQIGLLTTSKANPPRACEAAPLSEPAARCGESTLTSPCPCSVAFSPSPGA